MTKREFLSAIESFDEFGTTTHFEKMKWSAKSRSGTTTKAFNEYWTSGQRQAHSLHEISYRACFKPQLPSFFISRLTQAGDAVYDPFMGRGTTLLEAFLLGRKPLGNDINPLSRALLEPRLDPPTIEEITERVDGLDLRTADEKYQELEVFFHKDTLTQIIALKEYFLQKQMVGELDRVDRWIRMVALNRLTGHSTGFFSVYSLPPNQAVSIEAQRKINNARDQTPEAKTIKPRIIRRSKALLKDWQDPGLGRRSVDLGFTLTNEDARHVLSIPTDAAQLVVTSPPFLDVVNYHNDNWMRCWFLGIDSSTVKLSQIREPNDWQALMTEVLRDVKRILKPGGYVAFEVGEVKSGKLLLEDLVLPAGVDAGLDPVIVLINVQAFTKTANTWGVTNQRKGTNTNRIVVLQSPQTKEFSSST
ncbi:MAG TPA: DNA modification methylase [Acidobacteria bacterium]|nr:DNA modification methylase [Acidobacteriota bacterium]|tara:strand:- start:2932 stop:4185 length:1254 start_codon:yes stop_codon:yes gene_type:complete